MTTQTLKFRSYRPQRCESTPSRPPDDMRPVTEADTPADESLTHDLHNIPTGQLTH